MRFAIAVLACALAVANAQFGTNQYKNYGQYNRFQPFNKFQQYNNPTYKPYVSSTPFPVRATPAKAAVAVSVSKPSVVPVVPVVPVPKVAVPVVPVSKAVVDSRFAETIKYGNEINPDGSYNYYYETNNGIAAQEQGTPRNFGGNPPVVPDVAQGSFSWVSPEGKTISVTYVADENGYQPQSDALPVAPEIPAQIARALDYISRYAKN